jgi:hypothetical protein
MNRVIWALVVVFVLLGVARGEDPVCFAEAKLKAAVEETLWISDPTPTDMLALTDLSCEDCRIKDLTGIEYATNLRAISLVENEISDLTPLAGLSFLQVLGLRENQVSDLSPLTGLSDLEELDLKKNDVSDISPLSGLSNLRRLSLHRNYVGELEPLEALRNLEWLDLRLNPIDRDAWSTHIPQIIANNPGIEILYDNDYLTHLLVSSTAGGSVVSPGEGDFTYECEETVLLEAKADPCFVFVRWTGNFFTTQNPLRVTIGRNIFDQNVRANFLSVLQVIHVDDDAPGDPGPGHPAVSDPQENGTRQHPFDCIQEAIEVAGNGVAVFVHGGTYREKIDMLGRPITLTGFDPDDAGVAAAWPVIDGGGSGPVVKCTHSEDPNCVLTGLVLTGGRSGLVGAIYCSSGSPTIANCVVAGNRATDYNGAAIVCTDSNAVFINCTIVDNRGGQFGAALSSVNSRLTVINSILWGNYPKEVMLEGDYLPAIRYSNVAGGWLGVTNLDTDPLFAALGRWVDEGNPGVTVSPDDPSAAWVMGDYHLQSQAGRCNPTSQSWLKDSVASPCIDAGDPNTRVGQEPLPNGNRVNLGAYGGTNEASLSLEGG